MTPTFSTVLPSAGRLMNSLRDIGYDLPSAVADLVDNAIDANASVVSVELVADGPDSWLRVSDDGLGMTSARLDEAMRYGTRTAYAPGALGHFGLGLKTASLSQCRRLTVASRAAGTGRMTIRRWDLDEVLRRDSWDLERLDRRRAPSRLVDGLANAARGTVVLWEHLDRVLPRKPTAGLTDRVLGKALEDVREHLAMVFHRFLDGEAYGGESKLTLVLNDTPVTAWDPFARDETATRLLPPQVLEYSHSDGRAIPVEVRPHVLPAQQEFSSPESHRRAGGPNRWNRHQGFYIYRRERLIQAGGWNRLRTQDEHAKLARIAIDLPLGYEDLFAVDVAKMRVAIPEELRPVLREIASATVAAAQERYRDSMELDSTLSEDGPDAIRPEAIRISRDWPAILAAVDEVLGDDIVLRDRLLVRLANADPEDVEALVSSG